jgi:YidC/Oxa1 family membrane protein insertase
MAALQKKHKNDKERLNRELMDLYKKHGANPLGGCLPLLLQLPVFIALFNVLNTTIELRQAPFLWVADLASKDPYYVLPIIMGATMLVQQKIQPMAMDPRQAKIFMFLPIIFTILFLNFPGGLVLYWLTNNLLTILQQYITMKYIDPEPGKVA